MPKRASDFKEEVCYITESGKRQHKKPDCRFLKNRDVIKTNRYAAWLKGTSIVCVHCWYGSS